MGTWAYLIARLRSERGAALAEWGLLVVLIAIVAVVAVAMTGEQVSEQYSFIASSIDV